MHENLAPQADAPLDHQLQTLFAAADGDTALGDGTAFAARITASVAHARRRQTIRRWTAACLAFAVIAFAGVALIQASVVLNHWLSRGLTSLPGVLISAALGVWCMRRRLS